jgi:hypothetical protein
MAFSIVPGDVNAELAVRWLAAKKIQADDWEGDSIFSPYGDQTSLEALREVYEVGVNVSGSIEPRPSWAWGSEEVSFEFDAEAMLEDLFDTSEGFTSEAIADLQAKLTLWTNQHAFAMTMDVPNFDVVVMISPSWWQKS